MADTWFQVCIVPIRTIVDSVRQAYKGYGYLGKLGIVRRTCETL